MQSLEITGMLTNSHKMLLADVIGTEYKGQHQCQYDERHGPFQIHCIANMNSTSGHRIWGKQEGEKSIVYRMQKWTLLLIRF